jgi:amino acid adenylation domain-containing protein
MKNYLHVQFKSIVDRFSDQVALRFNEQTLTYNELNKRVNEIANHLIHLNLKPHSVIGLSLKRGPDLIASLIAILKAGHAYLPLDREYPFDRLQYMLDQSQALALITDHDNFLNHDCIINIRELNGDSQEPPILPGDLAYVIYTSGSTGKPKGVALGHEALSNLISWQKSQLQGKITLQFTPVSFDVHFQEIFGTLLSGGELILITENDRLDFSRLLQIINKFNVENLFLPFVALNRLCEVAYRINHYPITLKEVITAGEQLRINQPIKDFFKKTLARLHNHYGPSETHVVTSFTLPANIDEWELLPPIGKPIQEVQYLILDEKLSPTEEGELYISGVCLAHGYLHDEVRTNERFIDIDGQRYYRTGDLVKKNEQDEILYIARIDGQIKLRGYRIELGEIEHQLEKLCEGEVCVNVIRPENMEAYLCAYICGAYDEKILRSHLASILPDYMQPRFYVAMEGFPLTPSGKLDRKLLPLPVFKRPEMEVEFVAPQAPLEVKLASIWSELLGIKEIGIYDRFFDLGGTSLGAMSLLVELKKLSDVDLTVVDLFQYATIRDQIALINNSKQPEKVYSKIKKSTGDLAIVAMTGRFPGANSVDDLWQMLVDNKEGMIPFEKEALHSSVDKNVLSNKNYVLVTGEMADCDMFDASFFGMTPREAELMDPQQRKFLELAYEALELACINPKKFNGDIGVYAGCANNTYQKNLFFYPEKVNELGEFNVMLANEKDYLATRTSYKLGLTGPSISLNTGCSTSLVAIIQAAEALRLGHCEVALAGGISITGQLKKGYLHQQDAIYSKDGKCRPFDSEATGTIFTDGAGIIVLKRMDDALKDNDNILAVIKGVGINNDGKDKMSFTAPSVNGQKDAIIKAMIDANVKPDDIQFVETHGTATPVGDPIEVKALSEAYQYIGINKDHSVALSSVKANIGHLTSAAGVAGIIKAILCLNHKLLPGLLNFATPNANLNLDKTIFSINSKATSLTKLGTLYAGVSSFGVGGTNAHVVLASHEDSRDESIATQNEILMLSAKNAESLDLMKADLDLKLKQLNVTDCAYSLLSREEFQYRIFRTVNGSWSKIQKIQNIKKTVFMFPGQGAQYVGMGEQLMQSYPEFKTLFNYCCDVVSQYLKQDIRTVIFNKSSDGQNILNDTYYTQPAIFIFEYCLGRLLLSLGIVADSYIGHSIGELVAATLNGVIELDDALKVIAKRSNLMSQLPEGGMLTVMARASDLQKILPSNLQIAALNGEQSTVVAGPHEDLQNFIKQLDAKEIVSKMLHTSHAFHSEMMRPMYNEFKDFISNIKLQRPIHSIISTVTGKVESELFLSADYWASHILKPVLFAPTVGQIIEDDVLFIEVGPRATLKALTLKEAGRLKKKVICLSASDVNIENEVENLNQLLGNLWTHGISFKRDKLFANKNAKKISTTTYKFKQTRFWLDMPTFIENKKTEDKVLTQGTSMTTMNNELRTKIISIFEDSSGIDLNEYSDDTCFFEMGMDSLFLTQVALKLKNDFKVDISFRQLTEELADLKSLMNFYQDKVSLPKVIVKNTEVPMMHQQQVHTQPVETQTVSLSPMQAILPMSAPTVATSNLEAIVQAQLTLMQNQLALLSGQMPSVAAQVAIQQPAKEVAPVCNIEIKKEETNALVIDDEIEKVTLKADLNNAKKAFGAIARITAEKTIKDENAKSFIDSFTREYNAKTQKSKLFTQENRISHADPRAVTGFKPESKEIVYPIVVKQSKGQKLIDLDNNEYVDMLCGFGSNFFGNGNDHINKLVMQQLNEGIEIGPQHPLTAEVSRLINELTGNERSAFCNTGSEAVLGAMRIARTVSGKKTIVSFSGSYHGINDEVIIRSSKKGQSYPAAPGINHNSVSNMVVLDYGTDDSLIKIAELIKQGDVAAVIVEPVQSRRSDFHPKEFLQKLRALTLENDICLIFDEVITGFRIHPGGAQAHFGVRADLCTYGKIVGGGMPIGVVSGKAKYMDALDGGHWQYGDESIPTVGVTYFAGTFVRHPLALAAAKGALEIIKNGGEKQLADLNTKAQNWVDDINLFCQQVGSPMRFSNFGSLMKPKWEGGDYQYSDIFFAYLRMLGVHCYDGFPWFINLAHTDQELNFVKAAIKKAIATMQMQGLMIGKANTEFADQVKSHLNPPRHDAKLGKDPMGNPAWFIPNPTEEGSYIQLS